MTKKLVLFLIVMVAICEASNGICNLSAMALIRCMPAVSTDNPAATPTEGCCDAVRSLSSTDFQCLCDYKNTHPGDLQQYGVNPTRAAALPSTCGAQNAITCT
ncbi:hypothetical protein RND81_13G138600 [Saponaria officinalis]|uniref:Bifunctional inhibitor/plant lipid transfer protein/seed storage helical domain-containing protein n=1 Tax=Saponaria officinalis TaxID=3572 RepID=A0AAW1H0F1_SAPOF